MARKRLSDLLREEAQKPSESEDGASSQEANGRRKSTTSSRSRKQPGESVAKSKPVEPTESTPVPETGVEMRQVKDALERSQQRETSLKQEIAELQNTLGNQESLVKSLKSDLAKVEALKTELEAAKKTALQLAEENTRLRQALEASKPQPAPTPQPAPIPQPSPSQPNPAKAATPSSSEASAALTQKEIIIKRQTESLAHPIFPVGKSPGQLSDQDLGWVD